MSPRKRKAVFIAAFLLLTAIECGVWFKLLRVEKYTLAADAETVSIYPHAVTAVSGYETDGQTFTPAEENAQISFSLDGRRAAAVVIDLSVPLGQNAVVSLGYSSDAAASGEDGNTVITAAAGESRIVVPLKKTSYTSLKLALDAPFSVADIALSDQSPTPRYIISGRIVLPLLISFVVTALVLLAVFDNTEKRLSGAEPLLRGIARAVSRNIPHEKLTQKEWFFLLICFAFYFGWSMIFLRENYGPDEYMRYDIPLFIFKNKALPFGGEQELLNPYWGRSYGFSIMLPYLLEALFMKITSFFTADQNALWIAARFVSVLSGVGVAYYSICLTKKLTDNPLRWLFIIPMALTTQVVFLSSYVNLDSFSLFTVVLLIYLWVVGMEKKWNVRSCVWLGVALGMCLLSYSFAYPAVAATFVLYCVWHIMHRREVGFRTFLLRGLLICGVVLLISGWYFVRNAYLYNGDIFSLKIGYSYSEIYAVDEAKPSLRITPHKSGLSVFDMLCRTKWIKMTFQSLFYVLGYMTWCAPNAVYLCYLAAFVLGAAGCVLRMIKGKIKKDRLLVAACLILSGALTIGISLYYSWDKDFQPQGRYIITILPLLYGATAYGIHVLLDRLKLRSPVFRKTLIRAVLCAFILLNIYATFQCLSMAIY